MAPPGPEGGRGEARRSRSPPAPPSRGSHTGKGMGCRAGPAPAVAVRRGPGRCAGTDPAAAPSAPGSPAAAATAPGKKITARLKRTLPVRGPQAPTLSELMRWYCLNTNTHGCRRIVVSRGRLRRLLWILLTLSAVALILWQCAELLMNYYSASVSVTVQFQKLPFPAVTICNINPYK